MEETTLFEQGKISRDEYMDILARKIAKNRTRQGMNRLEYLQVKWKNK